MFKPFLRRSHKQHVFVFILFGHTHSLHWPWHHTLIIIHDTPQQPSSPISPGILHLPASFIFLQPSQLRCVHTSADQHTFNYQHIIKSRDKPEGPIGPWLSLSELKTWVLPLNKHGFGFHQLIRFCFSQLFVTIHCEAT